MCAKYHEVPDPAVTAETEDKELVWRSHNTGVVNFAYNQRELPSTVAKLAFAHEIGHSFGSPVSESPLLDYELKKSKKFGVNIFL